MGTVILSTFTDLGIEGYIEPSVGLFPIREEFPSIDLCLFKLMGREVFMLEIRTASFEMASLKALGINRLHAQFYQSQ